MNSESDLNGSNPVLPARVNTQTSSVYSATPIDTRQSQYREDPQQRQQSLSPSPPPQVNHHVQIDEPISDESTDKSQSQDAATAAPANSKKLRFGTIRRKQRHPSNPSRRTSVRLREISQHIPGLSAIVEAPEHDNSPSLDRTLYINQPLPEHEIDPETQLPKVQYCRNKVRTTKYTPLTFVPFNLWHQFHNIANIYFLFIVILSAFPIFGVESPGLAAVPIIVIVLITAIKDAIEDYRRMALDSQLNNTITRILTNYENSNVVADNVSAWRKFKKVNTRFWSRIFNAIFRAVLRMVSKPMGDKKKREEDEKGINDLELTQTITRETEVSSMRESNRGSILYNGDNGSKGHKINYDRDGSVIDETRDAAGVAKFKRGYWKSVEFGSIVKVYDNEEFPADLIVLSTSDPDDACYIETRNLDGETNLKVRQSLKATSAIRRSRDLERSVFQIESEGPHKGLYNYNGVLKWQQRLEPGNPDSEYVPRSEPVSINNLLLRGCTLRNTKWVIGVAVYTGPDSKVMLNSGDTPAKRSRIMRELNINVIWNFIFVVVLSFIAGVLEGVYWRRDDTSAKFFEFGSQGGSAPVDGLVTFWAAVILLQNLIPISLYISLEIVKVVQAFFIWNDTYMYYGPVDYRCTPKSWSISDDLGQIEYIFSDKTGTLTQNVMEFRKCTINGVSYGKAFTEAMVGMLKRQGKDGDQIAKEAFQDINEDRRIMVQRLKDMWDNPEMVPENLNFVSSDLVSDLAGGNGAAQSQASYHFLLCLALCHSVLPERASDSDGRLIYKAQSPDEEALVDTARDMGFVLKERTRNGVVLNVLGQEQEYETLCILEFNSTRKRMSVIVRMPDTGKIKLICKGADSMIYSRLSSAADQDELKQKTAHDLEEFANEGLRTLCIAEKDLDEEQYKEWAKRHDEASSALQNREELMEQVADEIEQGLTLIGGTAIEDRLQDGVPNSIALLGKAGIKIWVLTGDRVETAINIGYSCNLLGNNMELLVLQLKEGTEQEADRLLTKYLDKFNMDGSVEDLAVAKKDQSPPNENYALVIDGEAMYTVFASEDLKRKFLLLGKQCKSVLCCRVSPSQKAQIVTLVKRTLDAMTLSIGDGANDVAMITEADVGCGIAGLEGRQAVMSSDYAFGQFRFLSRLLLVHGRWAYRRVAEMTANLFYKNVVFTLTLFWYDCHNSFDGSYLFDYTYITLFNLAFTSLPVIFMGFLDRDVGDKISLINPELYNRGIFRKEWTQWKFWAYMVDGTYQSAVCYFFSYCLFFNGGFATTNGLAVNNRESYGVFTATAAIAACDLYVLLNEYNWDWLIVLIVGISIGLVFFWTGIYTQFTSAGAFYMAAPQIYGTLPFWANTLLAVIVCMLPRFSIKAYQKMYRPRDVDIIREQIRAREYAHLNHVDFDDLDGNERPEFGRATGSDSSTVFSTAVEEGGGTGEGAVRRSVNTTRSGWRESLERMSGERMRMSQEIGDLTTAEGLLRRASTAQERA